MEEAIWHNVITSRIGKAYSYQRTNTVCKRGYRSQKQQVVLEEEDKDEIHIVVLMRFRYIWYQIPKGLNLCVCVSIKTGCVIMCVFTKAQFRRFDKCKTFYASNYKRLLSFAQRIRTFIQPIFCYSFLPASPTNEYILRSRKLFRDNLLSCLILRNIK